MTGGILGQLAYINGLQQMTGAGGLAYQSPADVRASFGLSEPGLAPMSAEQIRRSFGISSGPIHPGQFTAVGRDAAGLNPAEQAVLAMRFDPSLVPQVIDALIRDPNLLREGLMALARQPELVRYLDPRLHQFLATVLAGAR